MAKCSLRSTTRTFGRCISKPCTNEISLRRALTTSTTPTTSPGNTSPIKPRQEPLTLLHKTSSIFPQVLEYAPTSVLGQRALKREVWEKILANVYEDLSSAEPRPIRLAVYGVDEYSGSEDFVTALLSNPLESDETQSQALRNRWNGRSTESLTISFGLTTKAEGGAIEISSPYLRQFSTPIELVEFRSATLVPGSNLNPLGGQALKNLFEADVPILLCNPLATSLESLLSTPLPTNTIIVIASVPSQTIDLDHLLSHVPRHSPKPVLLVVDPKRASAAINLLQSSSTSSLVVQRFQDAFNGSNISSVTRALQAILHHQQPSKSASNHLSSATLTSETLQAKLALTRLHDALSHCLNTLAEIKHLLNAASIDASRLNDQLEEVRAKVELEFLGPSQSSSSTSSPPSAHKPRHSEVAEAIRSAEVQMTAVMTRFTWWRMILRVDEVTTLIAGALQRTWCPELERKLLFHTGQLYAIQNEMTKASFNLLSKHRILHTNVLRNSLMQLEASPQHRLTTNTLTFPISSRRNQMIEYPTTRLHLTAQRAVLGMTGGIVGGSGLGWVGWMGWLVGSGDGVLGSLGLEPNTAMGLGALTAAASVRWAVGRWEKGKKKWWDDWRRVGDGLDRDLRATLDHCMQQQVGNVALATSKGLSQLVAQREEAVGKLNDEVHRLTVEVERVVKGQTSDAS